MGPGLQQHPEDQRGSEALPEGRWAWVPEKPPGYSAQPPGPSQGLRRDVVADRPVLARDGAAVSRERSELPPSCQRPRARFSTSPPRTLPVSAQVEAVCGFNRPPALGATSAGPHTRTAAGSVCAAGRGSSTDDQTDDQEGSRCRAALALRAAREAAASVGGTCSSLRAEGRPPGPPGQTGGCWAQALAAGSFQVLEGSAVRSHHGRRLDFSLTAQRRGTPVGLCPESHRKDIC